MRKFRIEQSHTETYTPTAGLALVGDCINRHTSLIKSARSISKRHGIPNIDLFRTYAGLLCSGKSDFEAAEPVRLDGAHDAEANRWQLHEAGVDYMIEWNPRQQDPEAWSAETTAREAWKPVCEGKREAIFSVDQTDSTIRVPELQITMM